MGGAMTIEQISWCSFGSPGLDGIYLNAEIHLGLCASDQLGSVFDDNFIPGTKTLVLYADSLITDVGPDSWFTVAFDQPYEYSGEENLIIDIYHEPGMNGRHSWSWTAGSNRAAGTYSPPWTQGGRYNLVPCMIIEGSLALDNTTFGRIKVILGSL